MRNRSRSNAKVMMFKVDDVFAAACAAQRINGEYLKEVSHAYDEHYNVTSSRQPNKVVMRSILTDSEQGELVTEKDRQQAQVIRTYFQCKLMEVLSGTANGFIQTAVSLASKEEFASNDWLAMATIACLPQSHEKGIKRDERNMEKMDALLASSHFGQLGDKVSGELTVVDSKYSQNWNIWYIDAKFGNNVILFGYKEALEVGKTHKFSGTIKAHRDNAITQLNRVKLK